MSMNMYDKLHKASKEAETVVKGNKVPGMHFNPLEHDEVQRVSMKALNDNRLYPICTYKNTLNDNSIFIECTMKIYDIDEPSNTIEIVGCSALGKLDKFGTGNAMSYARKYAFLNALNLNTGLDNDDGIKAKPFKKSEPQKPKLSLVNVDKSFVDEWIDKMQQQGKNSTSPSQFEKGMQPLRLSYEQELQQIGKDLALQKKIDDAEIKIKQQITFRSE